MSSELRELMLGAGEAKRQLFASEDFADEYGDGIVGRVKRRRAVSATAMGGGTLVAVGAIAAGAWQLPRVGVGFGGPGSSSGVVCTTSTPDAVAAPPDGTDFVVVDRGTGEVAFVQASDGELRAWHGDGSEWPLATTPGFDGMGTIIFASGEQAVVRTGGTTGMISPARPQEVGVMTVGAYLRIEGSQDLSVVSAAEELFKPNTWWIRSEPGDEVVGRAEFVGDSLVLYTELEGTQTITADRDGAFHATVQGEALVWTFDNGLQVRPEADAAAIASGATPSPSIPAALLTTCVTNSPEPIESASLSASPSASVAPTPGPSWSAWPPADTAASPFRCGFTFASDEQGSSALAIDTVTWKTVDEINAWLDARYMEGTAPHHASGSNDIVQFTVANTLTPSHGALTGAGTGGIFDPAVVVGTDAVDEPSGGPSYVEGTTFVAVRDSKVVGTIQPREGGHGLFVDLESFPDRGNTQVAIFLQPDNAMTACPGVQLGTDWELYAVVGEAFVYPDGSVDAPTYAWKKIQPED